MKNIQLIKEKWPNKGKLSKEEKRQQRHQQKTLSNISTQRTDQFNSTDYLELQRAS